MTIPTISLGAGLFAIHQVCGDEKKPFIGSRAECIRHAYKVDGDQRCHLSASILESMSPPDWWLLATVEEWAIHQLPVDHPAVLSAFSLNQGKEKLKSADWECWVDDWLLNGERDRETTRSLFHFALLYIDDAQKTLNHSL